MKIVEYTIKDALGIHARPAGLLVKEAGKFQSKIMIASPKKEVDAKRIIQIQIFISNRVCLRPVGHTVVLGIRPVLRGRGTD